MYLHLRCSVFALPLLFCIHVAYFRICIFVVMYSRCLFLYLHLCCSVFMLPIFVFASLLFCIHVAYFCICTFVVLYLRCLDVIVCSSGGCACQAPVSRDFGSISQLHFLQCEIQILRAKVFGTGTCHATAHNVLFQMTNYHKDILGWLTLVWKYDPLSSARYHIRSNANLSCFEL